MFVFTILYNFVCKIVQNIISTDCVSGVWSAAPIPPSPLCAVVQVCDLLDANRRMQEELMEKDQAIKVLQQKMADLKKTLQKELVWSPHCVVFSKCAWCCCPTVDSVCLADAEIPVHCPGSLGKLPKSSQSQCQYTRSPQPSAARSRCQLPVPQTCSLEVHVQ